MKRLAILFLALGLLFMPGGTPAHAEDISTPPVEVRLLTPAETSSLPPASLPANSTVPPASSLPREEPAFPSELPPCLGPTDTPFTVLASPIYPETPGWSFCVKIPLAPEDSTTPTGCPYTEYAYSFEPCGSCGTGSQWVHTWRRIVDPCFGYTGPWSYLGAGCLPC